MEFSISSGFIQGQTHRVCQDYTTESIVTGLDLSVRHNPLVIVSDGCSSIPDTDVGARLIALSARRVLESQIARGAIPILDHFGAMITHHACTAAKELRLREISCAATVLCGFVLDGNCHVYFYGDGVWFRRLRSGELIFTTVNSSEHTGYLVLPTPNKEKVFVNEYPSWNGVTRETTMFQENWSFPATDVVEFGMATDGVCAADRSVYEVLEALTGDRTDFLIDRFLDTHPVLNDDIGIASIRIEH